MDTIKLVKGGVLAGMLVVSSQLLIAGESKATGSGPNPFSDCGIGGALFPKTTWAAVSSNVIWDAGTTAVTSATASPETCNSKQVETAQFIMDNYDNLTEETDRGEGAHLNAMLDIMECNASSHSDIISSIRAEIAAEVSKTDYSQKDSVSKASNYYNAVQIASSSCSV